MKAKKVDQYKAVVNVRDLERNGLVQEKLQQALKTLINIHVANRGTKHQFVSMGSYDKTPYHWANAIHSLEFAEEFGSPLEIQKKEREG